MPDQTPRVDSTAALQWIKTLYPLGTPGRISLSHSLPSGTGMPTVSALSDGELPLHLAAFLDGAERAQAPGVYLRCTTVREGLDPGKRGGRADSVAMPGLWADLDFAGPGHRHDPARYGGLVLPPDAAAAASIVELAGLPAPTAWLHSGGGLYAWWLFDRPWVLTGALEGAHDAATALSKAWQEQLAAGARLQGWHYGTGVFDLPRVLRLPGTVNRKVPGAETLCVVLEGAPETDASGVSGRAGLPAKRTRFEPERLRELLTDAQRAVSPGVAVGAVSVAGASASGVSAAVPRQWGAGPAGPAAGGGNGGASVTPATDVTSMRVDPLLPLPASAVRDDHVSPLDDFEARHSWAEILVPLGWELVSGGEPGYCEWRRPGATHPLSATTGKDPARDRMYVFSDAAGLPAGEPLTKGYVYAALWHGGDMSRAARSVQALGYGPQKGGAGTGAGAVQGDAAQLATLRRLELVAASDMGGPRATRWLWADEAAPGGGAFWVPLGGIALLGGREGRGKTTWTYRLIAELTRGLLPGDLLGEPRSAVIAATEDDWQATIIPRLMAAGADLDRVLRIDAVEPDRRTGVSLPDDLRELGVLLAGRPDVALLVLDPIITVLSGRLDSHKDHEVRKALEPLGELARGLGVTILGLIHDNKSAGTDLSTRLMGSRAFVAVARAALVCIDEPAELLKDADAEEGRTDALGADGVTPVQGAAALSPLPASAAAPAQTFLLGHVKGNLGPRVMWSIRYRIDGVQVGYDEELGKPIIGSRIVRIGRRLEQLDDTARAAERRSRMTDVETPSGRVMAALLAILQDGDEHAAQDVKATLTDAGHSLRTIERTASELANDGRIVVRRGVGNRSYWRSGSSGRAVDDGDVTSTPPRECDGGRGGTGSTGATGGTGGTPFSEVVPPFAEGKEKGPASTATRHLSPGVAGLPVAGPNACSTGVCVDGRHVPWCSGASGAHAMNGA